MFPQDREWIDIRIVVIVRTDDPVAQFSPSLDTLEDFVSDMLTIWPEDESSIKNGGNSCTGQPKLPVLDGTGHTFGGEEINTMLSL
ncbi:hypothetical protein BKK79_02230 [Cupriavidus sp. USMAA2-4]|nr:hypothetical protein BKK79_02230 [Cupriavidus sp. USMAA2-4]